jgi:FMN phosphatase YigB (HAD superfamily)
VITDVGIDIDGVMYPFALAFKQYCQVRMQKFDLPDPTHWHFYEDWGMSAEQFNDWLEEATLTDRIFSWMPPTAGTVSAWKKLQAHGIRIHVLTNRIPLAWEQTVAWLSKNDLIANSLHFTSTKAGVLQSIAKDECALVDDYLWECFTAQQLGVHTFIYHQPWNAGNNDYKYVFDLYDFATKVVKHNEDKSKQQMNEEMYPKWQESINHHISPTQFDKYKTIHEQRYSKKPYGSSMESGTHRMETHLTTLEQLRRFGRYTSLEQSPPEGNS